MPAQPEPYKACICLSTMVNIVPHLPALEHREDTLLRTGKKAFTKFGDSRGGRPSL